MFSDPELRKNLLVSIVTSLLVLVFIEPLLKLSGNGLMWLSDNVSNRWTNGIYSSAALGLREKFSFVILGVCIALITGVYAGVLVSRYRTSKEKQDSTVTIKATLRLIIDLMFGLYFFFGGLALVASNFVELQLVASFNQRITVLAAKASDQQIKELRASWALMEKRPDYETINIQMLLMANQLNIKLPSPLWE